MLMGQAPPQPRRVCYNGVEKEAGIATLYEPGHSSRAAAVATSDRTDQSGASWQLPQVYLSTLPDLVTVAVIPGNLFRW
jgi:hypothetical protein